MENKHTLNDFLSWLVIGGILDKYFQDVRKFCRLHFILESNLIKKMDADDPKTLFFMIDFLENDEDSAFWKKVKEKYCNWLKSN